MEPLQFDTDFLWKMVTALTPLATIALVLLVIAPKRRKALALELEKPGRAEKKVAGGDAKDQEKKPARIGASPSPEPTQLNQPVSPVIKALSEKERLQGQLQWLDSQWAQIEAVWRQAEKELRRTKADRERLRASSYQVKVWMTQLGFFAGEAAARFGVDFDPRSHPHFSQNPARPVPVGEDPIDDDFGRMEWRRIYDQQQTAAQKVKAIRAQAVREIEKQAAIIRGD